MNFICKDKLCSALKFTTYFSTPLCHLQNNKNRKKSAKCRDKFEYTTILKVNAKNDVIDIRSLLITA